MKPLSIRKFGTDKPFAGLSGETRDVPAFIVHMRNKNASLGLDKLYDQAYQMPALYASDQADLVALTEKDRIYRENPAGQVRMSAKDKEDLRKLQALEQANVERVEKVQANLALALQTYADHTTGPARDLVIHYTIPRGPPLQNFRDFLSAFWQQFCPVTSRQDIIAQINYDKNNQGYAYDITDAHVLVENLKHLQEEKIHIGDGPWPDSDLNLLIKGSIVLGLGTSRMVSKIQDMLQNPAGCLFTTMYEYINQEARSVHALQLDQFAGLAGGQHQLTSPAQANHPFVGFANASHAPSFPMHPVHLTHQPFVGFTASPQPMEHGHLGQHQAHYAFHPIMHPHVGQAAAMSESSPIRMHDHHSTGQHSAYAARLVQGPRGRSPSPSTNGRTPQKCWEWGIYGTCVHGKECRHVHSHTPDQQAANPEYSPLYRVYEQRDRSRSRDGRVGNGRSPGRDGHSGGAGKDGGRRSPGRDGGNNTPRRQR